MYIGFPSADFVELPNTVGAFILFCSVPMPVGFADIVSEYASRFVPLYEMENETVIFVSVVVDVGAYVTLIVSVVVAVNDDDVPFAKVTLSAVMVTSQWIILLFVVTLQFDDEFTSKALIL